MNRKLISKILIYFFCILAIFFSNSLFPKKTDYIGKKIKAIEFRGIKNTSAEDLLDRLTMKKGSLLTESAINEDLKTLFNTGFFYFIDIQAELAGDEVIVIFEAKERLRVKDLEFVGADEVFPTDLREKIGLKEGEVITPKKVNNAREIILKKYRDEGYFLAYVKFEMGKIDTETNTAEIKFIIDEGEEIPVSKINILGNEKVDTSDIANVLDMKESGLFESGVFKESAFESDKQKIIGILKSKGYVDAELANDGTNWEIRWDNPKKKDKRVVIVNYKIIEGEQYFFNGYSTSHDFTVGVDGNPLFLNKQENPAGTPREEWKPVFEPKYLETLYEFTEADVGQVFDETKFFRDRATINEQYSNKGYLFAQVVPKRRYVELTKQALDSYDCSKKQTYEQEECEKEFKELNIESLRKIYEKNLDLRGKKFVHIDFVIRENNLATIESILIKGNKKTLEKVIRREILVKAGDLYNATLVNRSRERIFNLGYFKEVNLKNMPGSDENKMNLIIDVVEQPTGTISMGGGYGTITGFSIFTELGENNLNGTGQRINSRIEFGPIRRFVQVSWTEPWIFDKPWALTLSLFYSSRIFFVGATQITENNNRAIRERAQYERTGVGVSVGVGHRFFVNWSHFHRYSPSFFASSRPSSLVSDAILAEVSRGWQFRSQLTNGLAYDNRDNVFNPTTGVSAIFAIDTVGQFLGGQSHYDQYSPRIEAYHTWFDYTFGGLFRNNALRRWKVVQEFRTSSVFTFEKSPLPGVRQDKERVPYIQAQDRLFLGGYESLRGYFFDDRHFPDEWKDGAAHRMLWGSELRFPIEPSLLWLVMFLDAGAMFEQVNKAVGERREVLQTYNQRVNNLRLIDPANAWVLENYNSFGQRIPEGESPLNLNNPDHLRLTRDNLNLNRFRYSWGFGLRIQIPVLPLRIYFAQKLRYVGDQGDGGVFSTFPDDKAFQFVFGIGDIRF